MNKTGFIISQSVVIILLSLILAYQVNPETFVMFVQIVAGFWVLFLSFAYLIFQRI